MSLVVHMVELFTVKVLNETHRDLAFFLGFTRVTFDELRGVLILFFLINFIIPHK